ncbi:hypothetical protein QOZ80_1AG0045720 [Eleusine coracana subsp. coracana]|nr:hypothetical protein QOZ80_1AG0045720 [Eleusine coracana subsp. coracana]
MESGKKQQQQHHFVLVHGVCHGAWCWYKVATILESAGHRVTALDMAACGASPLRAEEVRSFDEYSRPLLDAVAAAPPGEKVVLVGHSFGGQNLALAMERHPDKVAVAVFVSAAVPFVGRPMSLFLEQHLKEHSTPDSFLGSKFEIVERESEDPVETFLLGSECMSQMIYQLSPPEDLKLATMLVRPSQLFLKDGTMTGESVLTEGGYGAVSRVLVVTEEDKMWPAEDQRRVAASCGAGVEVRAIEGADHMPMFSKPAELAQLLMDVAEKYA